jgi:hypothetical protein
MRPKTPKSGKMIWLERVGFIWNKLSFTKKVTARNIFRYKQRLFMTVIGIAACTGLMITGFGIKEGIIGATESQFNKIYRYNMQGTLNDNVNENGKNAIKEEAIKEGNSFYCEDCYKEKQLKQQIEEYYSVNFPPTTIMILRKVINQLLYTNNYVADYILFMLKKIHINKLKINNPFGLINYCNDGRNLSEWNKQKLNKEYKNIKNELIQKSENDNKVEFTYRESNKK